jgi:hypothetical protein
MVAPTPSQIVPLNLTPVTQYADLPAFFYVSSAIKFQMWSVVYDILHLTTVLACVREVPGSNLA